MKYSVILLTLSFIFCAQHVNAVPASGFDLEFTKTEPPNTIKGTLKKAKEHDFVLLRGKFTEILDKETCSFRDEKGDKIVVYFDDGEIPNDLTLNYEYYLWSELIERKGKKVLRALVISPNA